MNDPNEPIITAENIPQYHRRRLAILIVPRAKEAFRDPEFRKAFEEWQSRRNQTLKEANNELTRRPE